MGKLTGRYGKGGNTEANCSGKPWGIGMKKKPSNKHLLTISKECVEKDKAIL